MKTLKNIILLLAGIMVYTSAFSQIKTTELKKAGSNKIVVKIRFFNGSVVDPNGNVTVSGQLDAERRTYQYNSFFNDGRGNRRIYQVANQRIDLSNGGLLLF